MASNQTANFGLNQWAAEDRVIREEFNGDNQKIENALTGLSTEVGNKADRSEVEAVLASMPRIVTGTYTGDGAETRFISLGFTPKAIYVCEKSGKTFSSTGWSYWGGLAFPNAPSALQSAPILSVVENGFQVYYNTSQTIYSNRSETVYHYIAIG